MPYTTSITPLASAERSASGVSSVIDLGSATFARLALDVTAAGTGSLTVSIETARSSTATTWRTSPDAESEPWSFAGAVGTVFEEILFTGLDRYARVRWTLTGDPFTFAVSGTSVLVYCSPNDVRRVITERALVREQNVAFSDAELGEFIEDATDDISEDLGAVFELPMVSWGRSVASKTAEQAALKVVRRRGMPIDDQGGAVLRDLRSEVDAWREQVRNQKKVPPHCVDSTPDTEDGGAYVVTNAARGWGYP